MYKVMSINVLGKYPQHISEDEITESRMRAIAQCVALYAPDSVGLQEYGTQNQLFLPKYLPEGYAFVDFGQTWISTFYDARRLSLVHSVCKRLTTSSKQGYRVTLAVFADKQSGALAYIHGNLHLEYKDKETRLINAEEVNAVLGELFAQNEQYAALPLVITGDYNARQGSEPAVFSTIAGSYGIRDAVYLADIAEDNQDTFHALGVPAGVGNPCDHVLVNCDTARVQLHKIIKEDEYPEILSASDHYPVLVEFSPM